MTVTLDAAQSQALTALLEQRLGNLSSEIRHTDSPSVRSLLREEREVLRSLLESLQPQAA